MSVSLLFIRGCQCIRVSFWVRHTGLFHFLLLFWWHLYKAFRVYLLQIFLPLGARSDLFPAGISHLLLCLADAYSLILYIIFSLPTWNSTEKEFPCGGVSGSSNPALDK